MANTDYLPRKMQSAFTQLADGSGPIKKLFALHGNPEYNSWWDEFHGGSLDAKYAASVGTGTQVVGVTAAVNGTMTLTTGGTDDNSAGQALGLHWNGDNGIYFAAQLQIDDVTTQKFEIGLTDDAGSTDEATGAVNVKATPTFAATDCAVFCYDTDDDTNLTFLSNGGTTDGNADSSYTVVSGTNFIVEIIVQGDVATGYINGDLVGSGNIEGGNALTPWAYMHTRTGATRTMTVDWWLCVGPRS